MSGFSKFTYTLVGNANLDSVVFPDCRGPTMATALNWLARDRILGVASLRIILQKYTILESDSNIVGFFKVVAGEILGH